MHDKPRVPVTVWVLRVFAPVLLLVGVLGFVIPPQLALTSGAPAYNLFHLAFGLLGLGCLASRETWAARVFVLGFGLIDVYQAIASLAGLWPRALFQWRATDDVLHVVVGLGLVCVGLFADRSQPVWRRV